MGNGDSRHDRVKIDGVVRGEKEGSNGHTDDGLGISGARGPQAEFSEPLLGLLGKGVEAAFGRLLRGC